SGIGVPRTRANAIRAFAFAVHTKKVELAAPRGLDELEQRLCALPGIGPWTAQYVALRAFGEPDAFPAGDLGLRRALEEAGASADAPTLLARAASWSPFRAYATLHLWNSHPAPDTRKET
ncbi:MAG TPA: DNA-3-methyladenine glycosylase 2 family protein, partial [Thermoanaerobaculia bacterium]|nr:DNA-3-methyladenine glycosylase 2 family protein [Thermoanaerobaculia bacterium]